ncbi:Ketosamine-3-kinase [Holothuria leucospilota]|uniref:protein-ribulosamine 3-kinase n=1 Tax=Holothuria leucospilota TaxID=206669 RepID=A0A9Q0YGW5_HOLLE|nr:Ketosamine-3-kinase [Holothuria leucospilota]
MENFLKRELRSTYVKKVESAGGGCISDGASYDTDNCGKVFVKVNKKSEAQRMFIGESASLDAILNTKTVRVPKPVKVFPHPDGTGSMFVMEHLDIKSLRSHQSRLGEQLARLHLHNSALKTRQGKEESRIGSGSADKSGDTCNETSSYVDKFGFDVTTCCGYLPQDNSWCKNWVEFYTRQKLGQQLDLIEKDYGDREARELWSQLQRCIPKMFEGLEICPALLHGDLWGGNVGETDSEPVMFDPASFYGHSEYELGIAGLFGGFSGAFYSSYHKLIPKASGFEKRHQLYQLFHYLNHWNHFGSGYRGSSLSIMRKLVKGS